MKVLITSGGTKVKIDMVRSITNMSKGTFGSKIATCFLNHMSEANDLYFLMAAGSKTPMFGNAQRILYETFEDYERELFKCLQEQSPDIVILAAAVSDYGVENYVDGKIRSGDDMIIKLKRLPKLIAQVRGYVPNATICGFKLLVNSTEKELFIASKNQLIDNRLDLVVGNDLRDIKNNNHRLMIVRSVEGPVVLPTTYEASKHDLAEAVRIECMKAYERKPLK